MSDFHLIFCDPITKDNEVEIPFSITGTSVSWIWLRHLYTAIYKEKLVATNDRFLGWQTGRKSAQNMCDYINQHITILRKYYPDIFRITCSPNMSQEDFNEMHTWFEVYRGELDDPHPLFINGTEEFRNSIEQLNIAIHLFEHIDSTKRKADFNFASKYRTELSEEDNKLFEVDKTKNTVYLEFNMRGKNLMDFFRDEDEHVGDENIRRYKWIAADFKLNIEPWTKEQQTRRLREIDDCWRRKHNYLNSLGYYKGDPNNTLGWLPLATADIDDIAELIEPRQFLKGARFW